MTAAAMTMPDAAQTEPPAPRKRGGGPRTIEGKMRSRENAIRHGLRARLLLPDDLAERVERRRDELVAEYRPETPQQHWLIGEMARASAQLERCHELRLIDLGRVQERAETAWDDDRESAAEALAARLAADPARVAGELARTAHGAGLLIRYWRGLAAAARSHGTWDEAQRALAFDLLGTPAALRSAGDVLPAGMTGPELAALAEGRAERLGRRKAEVLDGRDESDRETALLGLAVYEDRVTARLRRYEAECRRALDRALAEFRRLRPEPASAPASKPRPKAESRRSPSGAAVFGELMADLMKLAPAPTPTPPAPAEAAPAPGPAPAPSPVKSPKPSPVVSPTPAPTKSMNRRARKAKQKRERLAARQAAR